MGCANSAGNRGSVRWEFRDARPQEPVSARVIVTDVQVWADDKRVESITVVMEDGEELTMRLGDEIEPAVWGLPIS